MSRGRASEIDRPARPWTLGIVLRGLVAAAHVSFASTAFAAAGDRAANVILFIGDGMGM